MNEPIPLSELARMIPAAELITCFAGEKIEAGQRVTLTRGVAVLADQGEYLAANSAEPNQPIALMEYSADQAYFVKADSRPPGFPPVEAN